MCVNNLSRVALDSGAAGIRTCDQLITSPVPSRYTTKWCRVGEGFSDAWLPCCGGIGQPLSKMCAVWMLFLSVSIWTFTHLLKHLNAHLRLTGRAVRFPSESCLLSASTYWRNLTQWNSVTCSCGGSRRLTTGLPCAVVTDIMVYCIRTLLVGRQEGHPACKKTGCWFVGGYILTEALLVL